MPQFELGDPRSVVAELWRALADDDPTVASLFAPFRLAELVGPGPGAAARLREALGRSRDDCRRMDVVGFRPFQDDPDSSVVASQCGDLGGINFISLSRIEEAFTFLEFTVEGGWLIWGPVDGAESDVDLPELPTDPRFPRGN